jgi:hypothetical protein
VAPALVSGTRIRVALGCNVSSGTASVGDPWTGTVTECVWTGNDGVIPAGSEVRGVITAVSPARLGVPAMLQLGIRSIRVNGEQELIVASSAAVVAGSAGARIMCPTAARFAIGPPGWQVVLSDLSMMTFEVDQAVAQR